MANTPKTLGQLAPAVAGTAEKLYTGSANGAVGKIVVNNTNAAPAVIGIEIRIAGAATSPKAFKYAATITQYQYPPPTFGPTAIGATDEVWVTADATLVNFNMDGIEK